MIVALGKSSHVSVNAMNLTEDIAEILDAMAWPCSDDYWDEVTENWVSCRGLCDAKCPVTTEVVPIGISCGCLCHLENKDG